MDPAKYRVIRNTLIQTHSDPQILECMTEDGILLYIRWTGEAIYCLEKKTGFSVCAGMPFLHKGQEILPLDQIEFYLEMYSRHEMKFI